MGYEVQLFIDGGWRAGSAGESLPVLNPATNERVGGVARAERADLDDALAAARQGFEAWRRIGAHERYRTLRRAAELMRDRHAEIAPRLTLEQGKPLPEALGEARNAGDLIDWFAEEARRTYGRIIPPRAEGVEQLVIREPVGPVAAFSPWNFPIGQAVRKIGAALAAGCSIILKGPEEAPSACAALVQAFADAGVPNGCVNLVFGVPAEISRHLIASPIIRKVSFTGSTAVGKQLASLAGLHMKRMTMELGGHAPAIVFADADVDAAARLLAASKYRNAGQVCIAPTRLIVHDTLLERFVERYVAASRAVVVGDGSRPGTEMGPLANPRRLAAMEAFVADARQRGGTVLTGGQRVGNSGNFFEPTVVAGLPVDARLLNEEPFGPIAAILPFAEPEEAIAEANRLDYGLAAYAYTRSARTAEMAGARIESGMVSINHHGLAAPEVPFGGVKESGYGSEGGTEALEGYLVTKFVTRMGASS